MPTLTLRQIRRLAVSFHGDAGTWGVVHDFVRHATHKQAPDFTKAGLVISTTVVLIAVSAWVLIRTLPGSSRLSRSGIFLTERMDRSIGFESAARRPDLIGKVGTAITDLRPSGTALFDEERVDVVSESSWIMEGTPVRIVAAEGYRHVVREVPAATSTEGEPASTEA